MVKVAQKVPVRFNDERREHVATFNVSDIRAYRISRCRVPVSRGLQPSFCLSFISSLASCTNYEKYPRGFAEPFSAIAKQPLVRNLIKKQCRTWKHRLIRLWILSLSLLLHIFNVIFQFLANSPTERHRVQRCCVI